MRINLLKKVVVGGLITSLCLCCCFLNFNKNVSASKINEDSNNYLTDEFISRFNFKSYNNIETLDDLKGTIWVCNFDSTYPTFSDIFNFYRLSYISPSSSTLYYDYPFYFQNPNYLLSSIDYYSFTTQCYIPSSNCIIDYVENFDNSDYLKNGFFSSISTTNYNFENNNFIRNSDFRNDVVLCNNIFLESLDIPSSSIHDLFLSFYLKQSSGYHYIMYQIHICSPFFLLFPNSNYTLEYYSTNSLVSDTDFLEFFKVHFTQISIESLSTRINSISKDIEFQKGYNDGYDDGYNQGVYDATDTSYRFPFLTGIFNAVSDVLALEIFPNIRLGYFVLIPLVLGITGMIFWFWRKD